MNPGILRVWAFQIPSKDRVTLHSLVFCTYPNRISEIAKVTMGAIKHLTFECPYHVPMWALEHKIRDSGSPVMAGK
jgi:hypothetical protein